MHHRDAVRLLHGAVDDAPDDEPADVVVPVHHRHAELQAHGGIEAGRRDRFQDRLEERLEGGALDLEIGRGRAGARVRVEDGELELVLRRLEVDEEVVDLVQHLGGPRVAPVDLVDDDDRRQPGLERLLQDEARLRQRPFRGIDEQQHAVDERERALDLGAEVGVPRRVDDVDVDVAIVHGRVLGHDRDALFTLEVHRVHHPLGDGLVLAEEPGLPEHGVDEGRLAVVDVGDDGDVSNRIALLHPSIVPRPNDGAVSDP